MAEIDHWEMWRARCALARCTDEAQHDLRGFAFDRFRCHLQRLHPSLPPPPAEVAWHAFESHLALGHTRSAKAWKEWLFARGGEIPTLDCIQGGATLVMRDVVREHLRREYAPGWMLSLDHPIGNRSESEDAALSLEDLLPDPNDPAAPVEQRELQELAASLFPRIGADLPLREQIALTVHQSGKALSHDTVTTAAQCGKSSLCNSLHHGLQRLAQRLKNALPQESTTTHIEVAGLLIENIRRKTMRLLESEHPDLFRYLKEEVDYAN